MSLPAVAGIKPLYPGSSVTVLAKARAVPVFLNNPDIDSVVEYDDRGRHRGVRGRFALARELRAMSFDLAVLMQNAFDAAFIAYLAGIPERVGYARDLRSLLLTKALAVTPEIKKRHQVFYYYNIVKELGGRVPTDPSPRIYIGREDADWADFFIKKNSLSSSVIVGAAPGASYGPAKRWPAEAYAEVLSRLSSAGCVPIIFGGPEDAETCKAVSEKVRGKHLNLAGGVTLRQFMAILSRLGVFITNDSGPMHIASALGVATVAIFGSTDPTLTGPLSANSRVLIKKTDCSPCFDRVCAKGHYRCLMSITVDEVFAAADSLLRAGAVSASGDGQGGGRE